VLHQSFPRIEGLPDRHARESRMESFLDARPEFQRLPVNTVRPGDLLGLRLFHCIDHLGVMIDESRFIHVLMHKLTTFDDLKSDPTWSQRLLAIWRPIE
jgi:cell wall-associated NlpC family hydrolase